MPAARNRFDKTINRSIHLFGMAEHWHNGWPGHDANQDPELPEFYKDIGRGGVVLAVAAMDAYFTKRFEEIIIPYIKKSQVGSGLSSCNSSKPLLSFLHGETITHRI